MLLWEKRGLLLHILHQISGLAAECGANGLQRGKTDGFCFIILQDGDLYRLTVSRLKNNATLDNFSLICERFYKAI